METIKINNRRQLLEILKQDISINYQLALHNYTIVSEDKEKVLEKFDKRTEFIFNSEFTNNGWQNLYNFTTPFGDIDSIKGFYISREFYNYNYYYNDIYQNYIFCFPKYITLNGKDYYLGTYDIYEKDNLLTSYLFNKKNIPSDFIYGVLTKGKDKEFKLVKNPNSLVLKKPEEEKKFYENWLSPEEKEVIQSISENNTEHMDELIDNTNEQHKVLLFMKKMSTNK